MVRYTYSNGLWTIVIDERHKATFKTYAEAEVYVISHGYTPFSVWSGIKPTRGG